MVSLATLCPAWKHVHNLRRNKTVIEASHERGSFHLIVESVDGIVYCQKTICEGLVLSLLRTP